MNLQLLQKAGEELYLSMDAIQLQASFFKKIKEGLPAHKALVDEVAEQLNLSNDSAYRRIRGDKGLTFDEIQILSSHFRLSLDSFLHLQNESLVFTGKNIDRSNFDFENYLLGIVQQLSFFSSAKHKEMYYLIRTFRFSTTLCFLNWQLLSVISGAVTILIIPNSIRDNF